MHLSDAVYNLLVCVCVCVCVCVWTVTVSWSLHAVSCLYDCVQSGSPIGCPTEAH